MYVHMDQSVKTLVDEGFIQKNAKSVSLLDSFCDV